MAIATGHTFSSGELLTAANLNTAVTGADINAATITATGSTTARSLATRAADTVNVLDYGAVGDDAKGVTPTNDTPAFQAAIDSLGDGGGVVIVPSNKRYLIDGQLTIKKNVTLRTDKESPDNDAPNASYGLDYVKAALVLNDSAAQIRMEMNCGLKGFHILRKDNENTYPVSNAQANAWTGTAVFLVDYAANVTISHCHIVGFEIAITNDATVSGAAQFRAEYLNIDCKSGIVLTKSVDVTYIENCHCWPIASQDGSNDVDNQRNGTAFRVQGTHDWTKFTNCFSFGYDRGFQVNGANSCTFLGCGADYTPAFRTVGGVVTGDSVGFQVYSNPASNGGATETNLIGCQAAGQTVGVFFDSESSAASFGDTDTMKILGCSFWGTKSGGYAVKVVQGSGIVDSCSIRGGSYAFWFGGPDWNGVAVPAGNNSAARWIISNNVFDADHGDETGSIDLENLVNNAFTNKELYTLANNRFLNQSQTKVAFDIVGTNAIPELTVDTVEGAIYPSLDSRVVKITSTDNFGSILPVGCPAGRMLTIVAGAAFTVLDGGTYASAEMQLSGGSDFVMVAGDTLSLVFNGVYWHETGRGDNS